jgi:ABC-type cobalamin/Fe3+-siderophores transport system ATPase subunit
MDYAQRLSPLLQPSLAELPLVVLLDIYPKRGPSQQLDIDDNEVTRLIQEFATENNNGVIVIHDITQNLMEYGTEDWNV